MGRKWDLQLISNNTEQIFKNKVNLLNKIGIVGDESHSWMWLMNYLKWFTHSFKFEGNELLEDKKGAIVYKFFWNGTCGLKKIGDEVFCFDVNDMKYDINNRPVSGKIWSPSLMTIDKKYQNILNVNKITNNDGVIGRANYYGWPLFMGLEVFIKPIVDIFSVLPANVLNSITKNIFTIQQGNVKQVEELRKQIEVIMARKHNLIEIINSNVNWKLEELKTEDDSEAIINSIKFIINYGFSMTGRIYNSSEKDERNLKSEVELNSVQFKVIADDYYYYLKEMVKNYDNQYHTKTEIVSVYDEAKEAAEEQEAEDKLKLNRSEE